MNGPKGGCSVIVTLTKHRDLKSEPDDEQLHGNSIHISANIMVM